MKRFVQFIDILQHGVNKVITKIKNVNFIINTDYSGVESNVETLATNDIASVDFKTNKPIFYDAYKINKQNGAFILIDYKTNNTVGVGFIQ